ncbi:Uncharacterized alpha/beta hydrolase domain [Roseivivax lentus]|uniref:Uncharacterized alpha/beta hydrolase domain n=1 Tax=Roseivivax lentus TaxID=633194 RepID=A0A1N7K643_9RHOB|nr:DUF2235 domain-containing protein [Roseivivax lentus]SIS57083.1 Uncharacterized alpha/beta hydrolase domain [Roseivivax lentus]
MPKKIILLLDGTSNQIDAKQRTNVLRLYQCLRKMDDQVVYYDPGVGTIGDENVWLSAWRKVQEVWGMATGWGLDRNVKDAYQFLVENYDPGGEAEDGTKVPADEIYLFGFSRGAYSARVLAGFLHAFGIIEPRNLNLLNYAYRAYKRIGEGGGAHAFEEIRLYENILDPHRPTIRFMGLFDTVASVIEWGRFGPRLKSHAFTKNNTSVQAIAHAVSIHERRTMFRGKLWPEGQVFKPNRFMKTEDAPEQHALEVWFWGVHGDIGGGYGEAESRLAKLPLVWMIEEAEAQGAVFWTQTVNKIARGTKDDYVPPDPLGKQHDSMSIWWRIVEILPRRKPEDSKKASIFGWYMPLCDPRTIPEDARLHWSVKVRAEHDNRWPVNTPDTYRIEGTPPED